MALLAEYSFDAGSGSLATSTSITDWSGNGNHLIVAGAAMPLVTGKNGANAVRGDGATYAQVASASAVGPTTAVTLMAWMRRTAAYTVYAPIIGHGLPEASHFGQSFAFYTNPGATDQIDPLVQTDSGWGFGISQTQTLNTWEHWALTWDAATDILTVFKNGVSAGTTAATGANIEYAAGTMHFGLFRNEQFTADILENAVQVDDVRVFDTALNAAAITTWMNTPAGAPPTNVSRVGVTTGAPGAVTSFAPTLPTHATGDRMILAVTGKYDTTTVPTINQSWVLLKSGTGGTGSTGADTGLTFWAVYGKDATSGAETAPTVTPGATAPNSWEWICATHRPAAGKSWADSIGASAAWVQSASDTTTGSPLTGTCGAWTGVQPTTDDAIFAVGVIPTDLGSALGATTITATGLSGGTKDTATSQYIENALGFDTAAVWAGWTGFTGTASAGLALSFTVTGATTQSGSLIGIALRQATSGLSGTADRATSVTITASTSTLEDANRGTSASVTATGASVQTAARATSASITASGALAGQASRATTATLTAPSAAVETSDRDTGVSISASGLVIARSSASVATTADLTAVAGAAALSGSADRASTATLTASAASTATADRATSAALTASAAGAASANRSTTATLTASAASAGLADRASSITLTTAGASIETADRATSAGVTAAGAAVSTASQATSIGVTATGLVITSSSASVTLTAALTASSGIPTLEGTADRATSVAITAQSAVLGQASRTTSVGVSGLGALSGQGDRATSAAISVQGASAGQASRTTNTSISGSGALVGQASRAETITTTATGAAAGRSSTEVWDPSEPWDPELPWSVAPTTVVSITAAALLRASGSASQPSTITITANGQLVGAPPSGTASITTGANITASGMVSAQATASRSAAVGITAASLVMQLSSADQSSLVTLTASPLVTTRSNATTTADVSTTASGLVTAVSAASRDSTISITASGQLPSAPSGTASRDTTASITTTGLVTTRSSAAQSTSIVIDASGQIPSAPSAVAAVSTAAAITAGGMVTARVGATRSVGVAVTVTGQIPPYVGSADRAGTVNRTVAGAAAGPASQSIAVGCTAVGRVTLSGTAPLMIAAAITAYGGGGEYREIDVQLGADTYAVAVAADRFGVQLGTDPDQEAVTVGAGRFAVALER